MEMIRGKIIILWGLPGSGLAYLNLLLENKTMVSIPCDNGATVRAFDNAFGNVIMGACRRQSSSGQRAKK